MGQLKKVCFVSPYSPKMVGGVGTYLTTLTDELKKKGIESLIITKQIDDELVTNANLCEIPFNGPKYIRSIKFYSKIFFELFKLRNEIDVLNPQTQFIISFFVAFFGKCIGVPVVTTIHGPSASKRKNMKNYKPSLNEKLTLIFSKNVVFVDEQSKVDYKLKSGIVIENGLNTKRIFFSDAIRQQTRQKLKLESKFVIIFTGRLAQNKGIYELLEAFSIVRQNNKKLLLFLLGPKTDDQAEKFSKKLGIMDYVIFKPEVENTCVHKILCAADLFVLPSYREGLPMSMLEAMACNLPVVVTNVGGIPYVIRDGENGLLIEPGNIKDLTKKLMWILEHEKERKELGIRARKTIEEKHNIEKVIDMYIQVYKSTMK